MSIRENSHISEELNKAMKMLGDAWILCIVGTLGNGKLRFNQLQRAIPAINPASLANRLKKLEKGKIVKRRVEAVDKLSVEYILTDKGRGILPVIKDIQIFADKFL